MNSILWEFDILLELLETERKKRIYKDVSFQKALNASWTKLNKYYVEIDKCSVYIIVTMLDS